jgi:hypothetical protein
VIFCGSEKHGKPEPFGFKKVTCLLKWAFGSAATHTLVDLEWSVGLRKARFVGTVEIFGNHFFQWQIDN